MAQCTSCGSSSGVCECDDSTLTIPTGPAGIPGPQGSQGTQGIQGIQGISGTNGASGPISCIKVAVEWNNGPGSSTVVITGAQLAAAGLLNNVYQIDANGVITTSAVPEEVDFVWQIWKFDGGNFVDAEVAGIVGIVMVAANGDISVMVNQSGLYRMIIIG